MPGVGKSDEEKKIAGAIEYPISNIDRNVPQPRQPTNLQGLLRFSMEATGEENVPQSNLGPMDEERKRFLEEALKSLTVDVIDLLKEQIQIIMNIEGQQIDNDTDVTRYLNAFERIKEHIDHIDIANDFYKIGGFSIFKPCLACPRAEIRAEACDVLAELCQNNPYCQRMVLESNILSDLIEILDKDDDLNAAIKALHAISCIVRQNTDGYQRFIQHHGLHTLYQTLSKDEKLRTKTAFLLSSLCDSQPDVKSRLNFLQFTPLIISLLSQERNPSHEHLLSLLLAILQDNSVAIQECKNRGLGQILSDYLKKIKDKPECQEEEEYCKTIILMLNPNAEI